MQLQAGFLKAMYLKINFCVIQAQLCGQKHNFFLNAFFVGLHKCWAWVDWLFVRETPTFGGVGLGSNCWARAFLCVSELWHPPLRECGDRSQWLGQWGVDLRRCHTWRAFAGCDAALFQALCCIQALWIVVLKWAVAFWTIARFAWSKIRWETGFPSAWHCFIWWRRLILWRIRRGPQRHPEQKPQRRNWRRN